MNWKFWKRDKKPQEEPLKSVEIPNRKIIKYYKTGFVGIKDICCTDDNITYDKELHMYRCKTCSRLFEWRNDLE